MVQEKVYPVPQYVGSEVAVLLKQEVTSFIMCHGLNVCAHPRSYVQILTPNVMVLGGRALGGT